MHSKDFAARANRAAHLPLERVARIALYTPRERAALGSTDALTRVADTHAPDADWAEARRHFNDKELVDLTTLIGMINLWNRLAIGFRYQHPVTDGAQ